MISFLVARYRKMLWKVINLWVLLLSALAIGSLVAEYGFYLSAELEGYSHLVNIVVLYGFVLQGILKLALAEERITHLRTRWFEHLLLLMVFLYLLLPGQVEAILLAINPLLQPNALTRIYLSTTQLFLVIAFVPAALRYSKRIMSSNIQPSLLILLSFVALIALGTLALLLPRATISQSFSFVDALFTATSAVCVTGLIVVDTATYFTALGHWVLMFLMQIGGLGIMTLTTFFAFIMGGGARMKEYSTMQSLLGEENLGKIKRTIVQIALVTFAFEAAGAVALYYFAEGINFPGEGSRVFFAAFHSISAYCNAGFTLTTENLAHSVLRFNAGVLSVVMVLIVLGGIGFPVMANMGAYLLPRRNAMGLRRLSVHTKLVVVTTLLLIVVGTAGILLLEEQLALRNLTMEQKVMAALFHSVSARTAGFNTIDIGGLAVPSLFLLVILMWIGASPGSTGGGVKTTTLALAVLNIYSIASGRNRVEIFHKRVSEIAITKAFSTVLLSFFFVNAALFGLLLTESASLEQLLFEVVSALSTVGLSTGITTQLSTEGKFIITLCMLMGRVGYLAVIMALTRRRYEGSYDYTEENVLVT
ncbi:MAG TPA: ATPase [Bacteroidetes bacterium]|nr:ATPase [Bacteroidota bacterium]